MHLDLSIIIVNWNTRDMLLACLVSVFDELGSLHAEVIVVDNASSDGSADAVASAFPDVRLIRNATNRGFAASNNQAMHIARGRYFLLLNPDTVVLSGALEHSMAYAEAHPDIAVLGCRVLGSDGNLQPTCFRFPSPLNTALWLSGADRAFPTSRFAGRFRMTWWDRMDARDVDVVSGMFMLVRSEAIAQVGLMDEDYFIFAEEADWCHRFRQAGWRCAFTPDAQIIHHGNASTSQAATRMYVELQKNLLLFHRKRLGRGQWLLAKVVFLFFMSVRSLWWTAYNMIRRSNATNTKAAKSLASLRFHCLGTEPLT